MPVCLGKTCQLTLMKQDLCEIGKRASAANTKKDTTTSATALQNNKYTAELSFNRDDTKQNIHVEMILGKNSQHRQSNGENKDWVELLLENGVKQ